MILHIQSYNLQEYFSLSLLLDHFASNDNSHIYTQKTDLTNRDGTLDNITERQTESEDVLKEIGEFPLLESSDLSSPGVREHEREKEID